MSDKKYKVLLVDDETDLLRLWKLRIQSSGYDVSVAECAEEALATFAAVKPDVILTDLRMPGIDGMALFEAVRKQNRSIPVIIITAHGSIPEAVEATRQGVFSFLTKPIDGNELVEEIEKAIESTGGPRNEVLGDRQEWRQDIISRSTAMEELLSRAKMVAKTDSTILIRGESGTGKELLAIALHRASRYRNGPFIPVNCTAIPESLLESELFGHVKGSFTGASRSYAGLFQSAHEGTLFLDEIGELDISVQAKLLRVLQEKEFERLGSNQRIQVNFRLVASTNRDLPAEVKGGTFREDLFYRINVFCIEVPPLRLRKADISLLVNEFLREFCARENKILALAPEVVSLLEGFNWPGNIRQLRNVVERAVVLARGKEICVRDLSNELLPKTPPAKQHPSFTSLKDMEARMIRETLERCGGNKSMASRMLGMSRKALYKRLADFNLT